MTSARLRDQSPGVLGVFGVVIAVTLIVLSLNIQRLPLVGGGNSYTAEFTDASGLQAGEEVRVAGVKVGQVTELRLHRDIVLADFEINGLRLGQATTAGIEVKTLLGQHYLSLDPRGPGRMAQGSVIPVSRTSTPVNIVPAFERLTKISEDIDTDQMAKAFTVLAQTVDSTAPEMKDTLRGLSRISTTIASRDAELKELLARSASVSGVVADRDADIVRLLEDSRKVLTVLDRRKKTIEAIIADTRVLARELRGLVRDNEKDLGPALDQLNGVLKVLRANRSQIDEIIRYGSLYAREFVTVGGTGPWLESTLTLPKGFAVCVNGNDTLSRLLSGPLSQLNQQVNGSGTPCLPLGPAAGTQP